jgi:serine/threonine-protein kinase RsbW
MPPPPSDYDDRPPCHDPGNVPAPVPALNELGLRLTAEWVAPSIARERVSRWLRGHRWSPSQLGDIVLAVSEAVSNSIEHGYGISPTEILHRSGVIELTGRVLSDADGYRHVELTIRDVGRWRPPAADRDNRRRGIPLMRACMDQVSIDGTSSGTTVVLHSRPIPPAPAARSH